MRERLNLPSTFSTYLCTKTVLFEACLIQNRSSLSLKQSKNIYYFKKGIRDTLVIKNYFIMI